LYGVFAAFVRKGRSAWAIEWVDVGTRIKVRWPLCFIKNNENRRMPQKSMTLPIKVN
jgi:hypothetical protein